MARLIRLRLKNKPDRVYFTFPKLGIEDEAGGNPICGTINNTDDLERADAVAFVPAQATRMPDILPAHAVARLGQVHRG